ncbi:hypothetical protein [Paenibacillus phocaensis]|uniref:hypothetical protein n=1 Tax=Paenibacillus phocaensis TaxID=1776378 RepID=UPI000839C382|nr:hypothetical protein [Paenibacillus phocaensis]
MVKIKIVKTGSGFPPVGSIHGARRLNRDGALLDLYPDFQIIGGGYSGTIIPFKCAFVLPEERTYTEAEYTEILKQRDKAIDDLAKYAQNIVDLQNELNQMRRKIEVPRRVANAIETLSKMGWTAADMYESTMDPDRGEFPNQLVEFASVRGRQVLLEVLVNGYTIEKTAEDRLKEKVAALIDEWYNSSETDAGYEAEIQQLADRIVEHAKQLT